MKNRILILSAIIIMGCNTSSSKYEVDQTVSRLSEALGSDKEANFQDLILNRPANMPSDFHYDLLHRLYNRSTFQENTAQPELIDEFNHMGQMVYRLPYFQGTDSLTGITKINLILYFGPEDLFPKNRFSEFETEIEYDKVLRQEILEEKFKVDFD